MRIGNIVVAPKGSIDCATIYIEGKVEEYFGYQGDIAKIIANNILEVDSLYNNRFDKLLEECHFIEKHVYETLMQVLTKNVPKKYSFLKGSELVKEFEKRLNYFNNMIEKITHSDNICRELKRQDRVGDHPDVD